MYVRKRSTTKKNHDRRNRFEIHGDSDDANVEDENGIYNVTRYLAILTSERSSGLTETTYSSCLRDSALIPPAELSLRQ